MAYELVELSTGNLVGYYESEEDALRDVLRAVQRDGLGAVATLALGIDAPDGSGHEIARGVALASRAGAQPSATPEQVSGVTNGKAVPAEAQVER
jgi:hypothetical protein